MIKSSKNKFFIKTTDKGQSVFSSLAINSKDLIAQFTGKIYPMDEIDITQRQPIDHYMQIGENILMGPSGKIDDLINHSCEPNCGLRFQNGNIYLYAIKNIKANEELTWDYSTTMLNDPLEYACLCGSKICRGRIKNFKDLPEVTKRNYLKLNIVPNYIKKAYRKEKIRKLFNYLTPNLITKTIHFR